MDITIDTSALIAVIGNGAGKAKIIEITMGSSLVAPPSVHWEVGNAFSAMFKRGLSSVDLAKKALQFYQEIPIKFIDVPLSKALELSRSLNIYAYDAYLIQCAQQTGTSLLTLDNALRIHAKKSGVEILEL